MSGYLGANSNRSRTQELMQQRVTLPDRISPSVSEAHAQGTPESMAEQRILPLTSTIPSSSSAMNGPEMMHV